MSSNETSSGNDFTISKTCCLIGLITVHTIPSTCAWLKQKDSNTGSFTFGATQGMVMVALEERRFACKKG